MNISQQQDKKTEVLEEEIKNLIEAALYVSGYPLELKTLCSITKTYSKKRVYDIAKMLVEEYKKRNGALEIIELENNRFVMQLKPTFVSRVRRLPIKSLLTEGPLKTLSYIAYRQPAPQGKVIAVRGTQAYEHIKKLLEMGLIAREKFGRSHMLKTTELFADYFDLSKELKLMKKQLEALFSTLAEKSEQKAAERPTSA